MYWSVNVAHASPKKIQVVGAAMTWRSPVLMVILQMRVQHYLICMSGVWDWKESHRRVERVDFGQGIFVN